MNRIWTESEGFPAGFQHRRRGSLEGISRGRDENLELFQPRSILTNFSDESETVPVRLGKISVGSGKVKGGMDDLLTENGGKHDYDWLLTPPGTPVNEAHPSMRAPRDASSVRSVSVTKASRFSSAQSVNNSTKPVRSSSVSRPSISSPFSNGHTHSINSHKSILNTSTNSVTSRPSTPGRIPTRPLTPAASFPARSSTPAKSRPTSSTRASTPSSRSILPTSARPSTPTTRPQIPATKQAAPTSPVIKPVHSPNSLPIRTASRPSTPTRRLPAPTPVLPHGRSSSVGRISAPIRNPVPATRGSSPGPRLRPAPLPLAVHDFPLDVPPNLRTTLPNRSVSAAKTRPGSALTVRGNSMPSEPLAGNSGRRQSSSPVVTRGRLVEVGSKGRVYGNGHEVSSLGNQKSAPASEPLVRRLVKPAAPAESTGFGRTISKKSLDMALRHMDIRHSTRGIRPLSGTSLFPQSIRSSAPKSRPASASNSPVAATSNGSYSENDAEGKSPDSIKNVAVNLREPELSVSSRYDSILLKEDLKNTNWLHSLDDKSDQTLIFDHRFEQLPEPFGLL